MEKPPAWADTLLTFWVIVVGVVSLGGYFSPALIGIWTGRAIIFYAIMVLFSALMLAGRYLEQSGKKQSGLDPDRS